MGYKWKEKWGGIIVPPITCFTPDLNVDYDALKTHFRYLINSGVCGMAVGGHTGEGETLKIEERNRIIEIAQEEAKGRIPIAGMLHGALNYEEGIEQAKVLEKIGVDYINILSPNLYLFDARQAPEQGIEYHKAIARAINIPVGMHQVYGTANEYPTTSLVKMFKEIDNLIKVKLATGPSCLWHKLEADMRALRAIGRDNVYLFTGGTFLPTFAWGVDGAGTGYELAKRDVVESLHFFFLRSELFPYQKS